MGIRDYYHRRLTLYIIAMMVFLFMALMLSFIAMETEVVREHKVRTIDLSEGLLLPVFKIFGYSPEQAFTRANLTITSYCNESINITFTFLRYENGGFVADTVNHVLDSNSTLSIEMDNMHTLISINKTKCKIRFTLDREYTVQKYGFLSFVALIMLVVGTTLIIMILYMIMAWKTLARRHPMLEEPS